MKNTRKNHFKQLLFVSTALTACVYFSPEALADTPAGCAIDGSVDCTITTQRRSGGSAIQVSGPKTLTLTGTIIPADPYKTTVGLMQTGNNGIVVSQAGATAPTIVFRGGALWDISSYIPSLPDTVASATIAELPVSLKAATLSGTILIANGFFEEKILIYKGHNKTLYLDTSGEQDVMRAVMSSGGIDISGGNFYFSGGNGDVLLRGTTLGTFALKNGVFNVGYTRTKGTDAPAPSGVNIDVRMGSEDLGNVMYVHGGTFRINTGSVLKFQGLNVILENKANYTNINFAGGGTLALESLLISSYFVNINAPITWEDGTIRLDGGNIQVNDLVTINQLTFFPANSSTLELKSTGKVTVKKDLVMNASDILKGSGELFLAGSANATFGQLWEFGTLSIDQGTVNFIGNSSISTVNMIAGTVNVNTNLYIGTLNMGASTYNLNASMTVDNLNFENGTVIFKRDQATLQLNGDSTILNTTTITVDDKTATQARVMVGADRILTFADATGNTTAFNSPYLVLRTEPGATINFNNTNGASFKELQANRGTVNFNKSETKITTGFLGDTGVPDTYGVLNVLNGAKGTFGTLTTYAGSRITVNAGAELSIGNMNMEGSKTTFSSVTGGGTLRLTAGTSNLGGLFNNFNSVIIDASTGNATVNFKGQTGNDSIKTLTIENGAGTGKKALANIYQGASLTLDFLKFGENGGEVNIMAGATLALKQSPNESASSVNNKIGGDGTLELLNNTSIQFGGGKSGGLGYLGGLKIGTGTATITADTVLGSVTFSSYSQGGTLSIEDKATLKLRENLVSSAANIVTGEGTLSVGPGDSDKWTIFGGEVRDLNQLYIRNKAIDTTGKETGSVIANAKVTFGFSGVSTIKSFESAAETTTLIVNNGTLQIENSLKYPNTGKLYAYGSGTLFLNNGNVDGTNGEVLGALKVGTGTVSFGKAGIPGSYLENLAFNKNSEGAISIIGDVYVTKNAVIGTGNAISGASLHISGNEAVADFGSDLSNLDDVAVEDGAKAYINTSTSIVNLSMSGGANATSTVDITQGNTLTLSQAALGDDKSIITGKGTLSLGYGGSTTVSAFLTDLNNLNVFNSSVVELEEASKITSNVNLGSDTELKFAGGSIGGTLSIGDAAIFEITEKSTITNVSMTGSSSSSLIVDGKELVITNKLQVVEGHTLSGADAGKITLSGNASAQLGSSFNGKFVIGSGILDVTANISILDISFANGNGGTIRLADGKVFSIGKIVTSGKNNITGNGILNLSGSGSVFGAKIDHLGELRVSSGTAQFNNSITIDTLNFIGGGALTIQGGSTMNVGRIEQNTGIGSINGGGSLVLGNNNSIISTGGAHLGALTIGKGTATVATNSSFGKVVFSDRTGQLSINSGATAEVKSNFNAIGTVSGDGTLKLTGSAGATFSQIISNLGKIESDTGALRFNENSNFSNLTMAGGSAYFRRTADISTASLGAANVTFNSVAGIGSLTVGTGTAEFKQSATIGTISLGTGTILFNANSAVNSNVTVSGGTLNLDKNVLTVSTGSVNLNNNSKLALRISRASTDEDGNVQSTGYGKLVAGGATGVNLGTNTKLVLTIDYGLKTKEEGTILQLVEGNVTGTFNFSNNRYSLTELPCSSGPIGLCYKLVQTSTGAEVVEIEQGSNNNSSTAGAFLDGELFDESSPLFAIAEHLDNLSQNKDTAQAYLNALTALAPDITGAMTHQPIKVQGQISNALMGRMNGLQNIMGSSSGSYKEIQKMYGRSGGSPYQQRFMRSDDYYRRAGYYDETDQPATRRRPAYKPQQPVSQEEVGNYQDGNTGRYAKKRAQYSQPKTFGLWAEGFYNKTELLSSNKPEGFSGDTTGIAIGADVALIDSIAVGIGFASTTSDVDSLQRTTDVDGKTFFAYGMFKPSDWFISAILNYGTSSFEETKNISGISITDNYDATSFGGQIMYGRDYKTWRPAIGLRYSSVKRDAHTDSVGQNISKISNSVLTGVAELRWNKDFTPANNKYWHTEVVAGITYDFSSEDEDATVFLPNNSTYSVEGKAFNEFGASIGANVAYIIGEHVDISAGYNYEFRQDYKSHTGMITFRYSF